MIVKFPQFCSHSGEGQNPGSPSHGWLKAWVPAFVGMTALDVMP